MFCHHCGSTIEIKDKVGRQHKCPQCESYLHCCMNCRFYAETAYHQCREPESELVTDKKNTNFCDYFEPSDKQSSTNNSRAEEARRKLDQLFNK